MKLKFFSSFLVSLLALLVMPAFGATLKQPEIDASSYMLMDALTGDVIAEKDADTQRPPASLTKMMTAYLAYEAIKEGKVSLEDTTVISQNSREATGSRMFVEIGAQVSLRELLLGLVVQSGNDAAVALAEHLGGSEEGFVELMNIKAKQLGMMNTNFATPTGLSAKGQLSTARDLALLARAISLEFPELYELHSVLEFEYNGILQRNRNRMLEDYRGSDGIKTGYTRSAGYCLAASAVRHGMRLVGVILDSSSSSRRTREMISLFNHGYNNFRSVKLFNKGQKLDEVKVWGGAEQKVAVGYGDDEPLKILLSKINANKLKAVLENSGRPVEAPVSAGDEIAMIKLIADDEVIITIPAVALADVELGPWWQRLSDYVRLHWLLPGGTTTE